jgi:gliding motility-associated-like protein
MKKLLLLIVVLGFNPILGQSIVVNDPADPQTAFDAETLIREVLVSGSSCVDIELVNLAQNPNGASNINERSWGYFKRGNTNFPFEEGIILSSGFAVSAEGPNISGGTSDSSLGWEGDIDIKTLLDNEYGSNVDTNNATVFEFTFSTSLDQVSFEFIFASEEYEDDFECVDLFRDGFAFLVKGPGIPDDSGAPFGGTNIASVTGSNNVPVSTASIHRDTFLCGFEIPGVNYFPEFYVTNSAPATNEIEFDGLTVALTTATVQVIPDEIYTLKMVIADRGDSSFDSAVFLNAGSLNIGNVDLGDDILAGDPEAKCEGEIITLDAGENPGASFQWFRDGVEIPGATNQTLDVSESGLYGVEVVLQSNPDCILSDEVLIEFIDAPDFDLGEDQLICEAEQVVLDATPQNIGELANISYVWLRDGSVIPGEDQPTLVVTETGQYTAEVTGNECTVADVVFIELVSFTVDIGDVIEPCGDDTFEIVPLIEGADPAGATYLWSTGETTPTITVSEDGIYSVEVTIDGCTESDEVTINFRTLPQIELGEDLTKCAQDIIILDATPLNGSGASFTYTWFKDGGELPSETAATIEVQEAGIYTVEVNDDGCVASDTIDVTFYENENCVVTQGISPNGDGLNDNLDLEFLNDRSGIVKIAIYNRLGKLVYEKENYINEWGGQTDDGTELPVGTYFYIIQLETDEPLSGWIYLNR